jgi:hypothetical protein
MPVPYGLLPHQLLEIIDNDRILPGVSKVYKIAEDFPYINFFEFNDKDIGDEPNFHQRALLFDPVSVNGKKPNLFKVIQKFKSKSTESDKLVTFNDFNNIRYSHIYNTFNCYNQLDNTGGFKGILERLKTPYINFLFKQLTTDIMDKISICHQQAS